MAVGYSLLFALLLSAAPQAPSPPAATAIIRGRVVAADTGTPVRGARVVLSQLPTVDAAGVPILSVNLQIRDVTTGRSGTYEFGRLEPGRYEIQPMPVAESSPFVATFAGRIVEVAAGQVLNGVDVPLTRGGVIAGRVTDVDGNPLTSITVFALAVTSNSSGRVRQYNAAGLTDDLGQFRIYGLHDGQFLVCAESRVKEYVFPGSPEPDALVPTFYPSTTSEDAARPVKVRAGAETPVEVRMLQGRRVRLTGVVLDSRGSPIPRVVGFVSRPANRIGGAPGSAFTTDQFGRFEVRDLTPGSYTLNASKLPDTHAPAPAGPMELANVPLAIAGSDIDHLIVRTAPGATLRGQLDFDRPPADSASLRVAITIGNPDGTCVERSSVTTFADENHAFEVGDLFCPYLVRASVPGFVVKSVVLNGSDITDTPHRFATGDRVTLVLTSHTSTVDGSVVNDDDTAVTDCEVVAFSEDPAHWIGSAVALSRAACDSEGRFRLTQMLPGRYVVVAAPRGRLPASSGLDGTVLEELSRRATAFVVGEDETRTVELRRVIDPFR